MKEQADRRLTLNRRGLFMLVSLYGHLAVAKLPISIEWFRLFLLNSMKKLVLICLSLFACVLISCSSSDEDRAVDNSNIVSHFLGYWSGDFGSFSSVFFWDDRKVTYGKNQEAIWDYNDQTSILSTTIDGLSWQVLLSDSVTWTGRKLWDNGNTGSYKRDLYETIRIIITSRKWKMEGSSMSQPVNLLYRKDLKNREYVDFEDKDLRWTYSNYLMPSTAIVSYKNNYISSDDGKIII